MRKKLLALLMASTMLLSVCACGGGNNNPAGTTPGGSTPGTTQNTPAPTKPADPTPTPTPVPVEEMKFSQSPTLTGNVEDRLPTKDDVFVEQVDATGNALAIGTYGGDINLLGSSSSWNASRPILESIIHYNSDGTYYPNVIKSYEHNADYTEWTFHLREGMRWSDGDDFNADDITFWYYMCHLNNYDTKKSWAALKETVNGEDAWATLTKVDNYTVKWTFVNPKIPSAFIENGDFKWCWAPSHYLKDLIPASIHVENPYWENTGISDDQVLLNAKAKGIEKATIKDLGKALTYYFWNEPGIPTLNAWTLSTKDGVNSIKGSLCVFERNPYFWKVDAEGQQLPYLDNINFIMTSEEGQDLLMFKSGELDVIGIGMQDIAATLSGLSGKAELRTFSSSAWGSYQVTFNYTSTEKNYADLFANTKFRQAMSICVDREEVSQLLSDGFLEPGQCAPAAGNFGYDADWEKKWTEYDVASAKKLFEECGLVMGSDGFYNFADGSDVVLTFYYYDASGAEAAYPVLEKYFEAAGIQCAEKSFTSEAFDQEIDNNNWLACLVPHTAIGGLSLKDRVAPFAPVQEAAEWYGEYGAWVGTNGEQGVQPTGDMAKLAELAKQWEAEPDNAKKDAIATEIYKIHKDNLWSIAYLKAAGTYSLINSKIKNYPDNLASADLYQYANIVHYWTLYKEK